MRFSVDAETLWLVLATEAHYLQASEHQRAAIERLASLSEKAEIGEHRVAELDIEMHDTVLHVCISECDRLGAQLVNGAWCRLSINPAGRVSMTDSVDEERISTLEPD
jgi:hypothetical protein